MTRGGRLPGWSLLVLMGCASGVHPVQGAKEDLDPGSGKTPSLALLHGKVFTSDVRRPWAEALGIAGDRIAVVGTDEEVQRWAAGQGNARIIDVAGRVVIPGINDAHVHEPTVWSPIRAVESEDPSAEELLAGIARASGDRPPGAWLGATLGIRVLDDLQAGRPGVDRSALDRVAPDRPVWLEGFGGHVALLNSAALRALGVREDQRDEAGGWFGRDAKGRLNGYVFEWAKFRLGVRMDSGQDDEQVLRSIDVYARRAVRYGITSVQTMPGVEYGRFAALMPRAGSPIRWRVIRNPFDGGVLTLDANPFSVAAMTRLNGVKYILDGSPLEGWAAMRAPYADRPGWTGRIDLSSEDVRRIVAEAARGKEPLLLHCTGDRCTELVLRIMEETAPPEVWRPLRVRIEHGDGLLPDLLPRASRLGVVVVENPTHFTLGDLFLRRYGAAIAAEWQPFRSLGKNGIMLALGSDGPMNPYLNLEMAVTHPARPGEAITREEAVVAYTRGSAFAEFAEKEKGTLAPGMLADLAVLTQDIFTLPTNRLPGTESWLTIVGGRIVYVAQP